MDHHGSTLESPPPLVPPFSLLGRFSERRPRPTRSCRVSLRDRRVARSAVLKKPPDPITDQQVFPGGNSPETTGLRVPKQPDQEGPGRRPLCWVRSPPPLSKTCVLLEAGHRVLWFLGCLTSPMTPQWHLHSFALLQVGRQVR